MIDVSWIAQKLWLIPLLPFAVAGITAFFKRPRRTASAMLVIGAITISFLLSVAATMEVIQHAHGKMTHIVSNFDWFSYGETTVRLGFVLDPLSAMMLLIVSLVSLLVFIFSVGYMDEDNNATRFFCFLSFFAGAMLLLVIANSLLLLFIAWELVGLASYLLIGFWFHKPSAAAAMKKAFITTRVGDIGFFIGFLWFYMQTGTTLFYDNGQGSLETASLTIIGNGSVALMISLLIFCGAMGKSGQFPLHVWLPDAMEGPTPVSALIHAATMVAAGIFLVGRMYPLFELNPAALHTVAFVGAFTAVFAASIALAQWDIKRILAYSTVSQLGYMMMGLGVGGYVAGLFHLFTHAFFKALLFLGAGSIIHACHHEQDIRKLGGLRTKMNMTFLCYSTGMLALVGFPIFFSGFYSKDELLLEAFHFPERLHHWTAYLPFILGIFGAALTAFYMTRQMRYVFFGQARTHNAEHAHESSQSITIPLIILAFLSVVSGFLGFPGSSFIQHLYTPELHAHKINGAIMIGSSILVLASIALGMKVYSGSALETGTADPFEKYFPTVFRILNRKYYIDEFYEKTLIKFTNIWARGVFFFDRIVLNLIFVLGSSMVVYFLSLLNQLLDEAGINKSFDQGCATLSRGAQLNRWIQNGLAQHYLKITSAGIVLLFLLTLLGS